MKKMEIAKCKNLLACNGKIEKASKGFSVKMKHIFVALAILAFALPINSQALASDKKIKPGKKQATLILSDGSKIVLNTSSDTIVNSQTKGVRIVVDSTGINYITADSTKKVIQLNKKLVQKK